MSITTPEAATRKTGLNYAHRRPTSHGVAADVFVAVWCRSVGLSWTLELYELDGRTAPGVIKDWIASGVPISQPVPEALACELLADRGLQLFRDSSAGPCTHNRHGIGYVSTNAELIRLAHLALDDATETGTHPVTLAHQWIMAGYSPNATTGRIRERIHSPQVA
jgi:hypothetical protein